MPPTTKIEKFSARELLNLRNELLQSGIDSWQAAEVLSGFLTGRGYGVSAPDARNAVSRLEEMGCNLDSCRLNWKTWPSSCSSRGRRL